MVKKVSLLFENSKNYFNADLNLIDLSLFYNFQRARFQTLLERLAEGPVIGDGGFVFSLEKRGYVKAGPWTPEAAIEHPDAGKLGKLKRG